MSKLPDLEGWAVFAKVAETGSFARAAQELGLSQPTVSKAMARLEGRLGAGLFHRSSRRLALTELGRISLERASTILAQGEAVEEEATSQAATPRGLVRLAAPMSFGIQHLGPALRDFMAAYPLVRVELHLSDERIDLVREGYDVALRIGCLEDSALVARRLCNVRLLLVGTPAYFARHGVPAHPRDLADHVGLAYSYGVQHDRWRFAHAQEGEIGVAIPSPLRANNADVLMPLLLAGAGLALQPEFMIWRELRDGLLQVVLPEWSEHDISLHTVTPPSVGRPARVRVLIDFLAAAFARAPWASMCPE